MGPSAGETSKPPDAGFSWLIFASPFGVTGLYSAGTLTYWPIAEGVAFVETAPRDVPRVRFIRRLLCHRSPLVFNGQRPTLSQNRAWLPV